MEQGMNEKRKDEKVWNRNQKGRKKERKTERKTERVEDRRYGHKARIKK